MGVQYIGYKYIDLGEKIHIRAEVKTVGDEDIPFTIRNARYELLDPEGTIEDTGYCTITEHIIDALVEPLAKGKYELRLIYEIADETWIEPIRLRVS